MAGTVGGEHPDQPLDRLGQPTTALMPLRLLWQRGEQVPQALLGDREKLAIRADVHHLLGDAERDDLRVGHPAPCVLARFGQEIVSGAEHRCEQQVEVGEHRGPLGSTA